MPARWLISKTPRDRPDSPPPCSTSKNIGWREDGSFVDLDDRPIELAFKLYPWEWMFHDAFGERLADGADALDRAAMEGDPVQQGHSAAAVGDVSGTSQPSAGLFRGRSRRGKARRLLRTQAAVIPAKAPMSRWSAKALRWSNSRDRMAREGFIRQALAPLPEFAGQYPVLGSWLVDHVPCGLSIREDENPVTGNSVAISAARDPLSCTLQRARRTATFDAGGIEPPRRCDRCGRHSGGRARAGPDRA